MAKVIKTGTSHTNLRSTKQVTARKKMLPVKSLTVTTAAMAGRNQKITKRVVKKLKSPVIWSPVITSRPQLIKSHDR